MWKCPSRKFLTLLGPLSFGECRVKPISNTPPFEWGAPCSANFIARTLNNDKGPQFVHKGSILHYNTPTIKDTAQGIFTLSYHEHYYTIMVITSQTDNHYVCVLTLLNNDGHCSPYLPISHCRDPLTIQAKTIMWGKSCCFMFIRGTK